MSRYINPYTDFGFKRLFGTEANKDLLIDFLNCLLPQRHQIQTLTFRNTELQGEIYSDRKAIYDIYCRAKGGDEFIIEMQQAKLNFFRDRALFYAALPIREQAPKGEWNFRLLPVYFIALLDFEYDEHAEVRKFDRFVQLRDEDGVLFYDKLGFRFLQMPLFQKTEAELETRYDKWCYFLKHLASMDHIPHILNEPLFNKAFKAAEIAAMRDDERRAYTDSIYAYSEVKAAMDTSFSEGEVSGITKGREEARQETTHTIARNMKAAGFPHHDIARLTGLQP